MPRGCQKSVSMPYGTTWTLPGGTASSAVSAAAWPAEGARMRSIRRPAGPWLSTASLGRGARGGPLTPPGPAPPAGAPPPRGGRPARRRRPDRTRRRRARSPARTPAADARPAGHVPHEVHDLRAGPVGVVLLAGQPQPAGAHAG